MPSGIAIHGCAAAFPIGEILVTPHENNLVERANIAHEEAEEITEVPRLNRQSEFLVILQPGFHFSRTDAVGSVIDDRATVSPICFRSSLPITFQLPARLEEAR